MSFLLTSAWRAATTFLILPMSPNSVIAVLGGGWEWGGGAGGGEGRERSGGGGCACLEPPLSLKTPAVTFVSEIGFNGKLVTPDSRGPAVSIVRCLLPSSSSSSSSSSSRSSSSR